MLVFSNGNKWIRRPICEVLGNPLNLCISKMLCSQNKISFLLLQPIITYFTEGAVILCVLRPPIFLKKIRSNKPALEAPDMNQKGVLIWTGFHLIARTRKNTVQRKKKNKTKRFSCKFCSIILLEQSATVCLQGVNVLQLYIAIWIFQQMWQWK